MVTLPYIICKVKYIQGGAFVGSEKNESEADTSQAI